MMLERISAGMVVLLGCAMIAPAQTPPTATPRCRSLKDYRTVASRTMRTGKQVIAVDRDDRVLLLTLNQAGSVTDSEPLGYEQHLPAEFPYASNLPKDEPVITFRRVSCPEDKWRLWVALTVGFNPEARGRTSIPLNNRVLVFREPAPADGSPLLVQNTFREVIELTVDDVNGDQLTEIAAQYADADQGPWMKMWQIEEKGVLRSIPMDNIKQDLAAVPGHIEIGLGDYRHGGELLFTEQRFQTGKGWHVTRRYYDWDESRRRYQLAEVVQSDEINLK